MSFKVLDHQNWSKGKVVCFVGTSVYQIFMLNMSSASNSPLMEKSWFQDTKTGCEKQAHYFVQIRKLQDELINREQHNLINAMERLKQLTYPRKRPVIRNVDVLDPPSAQQFPVRNLNLRKEAKHKALPAKEKPELSPVSGKPLISKRKDRKLDHYHHFFVMPPLLTDRDIAKIVHHANATFPSEPSTYLLQPHLPSIPNVGRKTNFMVDNRLKLLTLAESEFPEEGSVSGTRKHLHSEKSQSRKRTPKSKSNSDDNDNASKENLCKKGGNFLTFDVDPNDPTLFSHCVEDKKEEEQYETTPLPPPNSRPSSTKSKSSQVLLEVATQGNAQSESLKESEDVNKKSDNTVTKINENNSEVTSVKAEMPDSSLGGSKTDNNQDGDQISDDRDMSSLAPAEGTQDGSENINDKQEGAVEIVQPSLVVTHKPATSKEDESKQEN